MRRDELVDGRFEFGFGGTDGLTRAEVRNATRSATKRLRQFKNDFEGRASGCGDEREWQDRGG